MPARLVPVIIFVGMFGVLLAWIQYAYYAARLDKYLRLHHERLWEKTAVSYPFFVGPTVNPLARIRFVLAPAVSDDPELEGRRLQARRAMAMAFISIPAFIIMFFAVLAVFHSQTPRV